MDPTLDLRVCISGKRGGSVKLTGGHVPHQSFIYLKEINPPDRSILTLSLFNWTQTDKNNDYSSQS